MGKEINSLGNNIIIASFRNKKESIGFLFVVSTFRNWWEEEVSFFVCNLGLENDFAYQAQLKSHVFRETRKTVQVQ